ncbi:MAG: DNA circularization protein [Gammaproteobacteria bacterium]
MSWRDQMLPGSFRGAPFLIKVARTGVGRRTELHQYPLRDTPWAEDLGRHARSFTVECFVLGADYMSQRNALMDALEQGGAGTLVHPYLGTKSVVVNGSADITEDTAEGGMARFSIPFAESGQKLEPAAATDTAGAVADQASAGNAALATQFSDDFATEGYPQWVQDAASANTNELTDTLDSLRSSIPGIPDSVVAFDSQLAEFSQSLASLIRTPYNLAASVVSLIAGLGTIAEQPLDAVNLYSTLSTWQPSGPLPAATTPARAQAAANQQALTDLVQRTAIMQQGAAASRVPAQSGTDTSVDGTPLAGYDTADVALAVRDAITGSIDTQQLTAPDAVFDALTDLRAAVVTDFDARAGALPSLVTFTPATDLPATVIAWRLYADASRDAEIVQRNAVVYPGAVPGGAPLEVASA